MSADQPSPAGINIGALTLGVGTLIAVLGTFTLTGTVGRVLRNEPDTMGLALAFLLLGALFLALAGLPLTGGRNEAICSLTGLVLSFLGLFTGILAGAHGVAAEERPSISVQLGGDGLELTGDVKARNVSSEERLVLVVDGLGGPVGERALHWAFVGPDSDGNVEVPVHLQIPAGVYDAVGVRAWTAEPTNKASGKHRCSESEESRARGPKDAGTGCVVLPLPRIDSSPRLTMAWTGSGSNRLLQVVVTTDNGPTPPGDRVAVVVSARRSKGRRKLYRAMLRPDGRGDLREVLRIPVRRRVGRVCAEAAFVSEADGVIKTSCPLRSVPSDHVAVELRPVGGRLRGT